MMELKEKDTTGLAKHLGGSLYESKQSLVLSEEHIRHRCLCYRGMRLRCAVLLATF